MRKQIFIDTDMGSDCDDVAAVAILAHFHRLGKINILGVSHTSANPRTVEYLDMVCRFYGCETESLAAASAEWGIGEFRKGFFDDVLKGFAFRTPSSRLNAVQLMRKQLSAAKDATVLCIGLVMMLAEGKTLEEAAKFGSKAASIACTRQGAQPSIPTRKEVERYEG